MDLDTLRHCAHPMDLLRPGQRDMDQHHNLLPNALLLGPAARRTLLDRHDALNWFLYLGPDAETCFGLKVIPVQQRDCFELAYLPSLPKREL